MQDSQYKEVLIVLVACIVLFLILAAIILLFLFLYQRRRHLQQQQMLELRQELKEQSLKAQLEIQEQTFNAISGEIHDNVGQILSLAKVQSNIIQESDKIDKIVLQEMKENISKAIADLRDLSKSLNSDRIRTRSIYDTIGQEVDRINRTGIIQAEISAEGQPREMDANKKLILFRVLQESIQNCIKHAQASRISIRFQYGAESIHVSIEDNGRGFDPSAELEKGSGQGLANMSNRIRLAGGTHRIDSFPQKGTAINLNIPYE